MKPMAAYDFSQGAKWGGSGLRRCGIWLSGGNGRESDTNKTGVAGRLTEVAVNETIYSEKLEFELLAANNPVAICADETFPPTLSNGSGRRVIEPLGKSSTVGARWVKVSRNGTGMAITGPGRCGEIRGHRRAIFRRCPVAACRSH
jgi:hypothetical protein